MNEQPPAELQAFLDAAKEFEGPSEAELDSIRRAVDSRLAAVALGTPPVALAGRQVRALLAALCLAAGGFGLGFWAGRRADSSTMNAGTAPPTHTAAIASREPARPAASATAEPRSDDLREEGSTRLEDSTSSTRTSGGIRRVAERQGPPRELESNSEPTPGTIEAERTLLETARAALARQQAGNALAALARHRDEYPRGELSEERDALVVIALSLDDAPGAQAALETFEAAHPRSVFLPSVRAVLSRAGKNHAE
jgi:hypothetical protein